MERGDPNMTLSKEIPAVLKAGIGDFQNWYRFFKKDSKNCKF